MRVLLVASMAISADFTSYNATAATKSEIMASRCMKYNFCMQRESGQLWWKNAGIELGMNSWRVSEPTRAAMLRAKKPWSLMMLVAV